MFAPGTGGWPFYADEQLLVVSTLMKGYVPNVQAQRCHYCRRMSLHCANMSQRRGTYRMAV